MTETNLKPIKNNKFKKSNRGRKKIEFTDEQFKQLEKLCEIQCSVEETSHFFQVDADTLNRIIKEEYGVTFSAFKERFSSYGKICLRRRQFQLSKTNASMAIFLGKQYLNQRDERQDFNIKPEISIILPAEKKNE